MKGVFNDEFLQISFASLKIFCWNFTSQTMSFEDTEESHRRTIAIRLIASAI